MNFTDNLRFLITKTQTMTKPELHCFKDVVLGILKSKCVFVNQIAALLRESLKIKRCGITECVQYIIRLKNNTKLFYEIEPHRGGVLAKKVGFCISQKVTKIS